MNFIHEHRAQVYLVGLQSMAIVGGSLLVTGFMKIYDPHGQYADKWPFVLRAVRSCGVILLLIPACWAYVTTKLELSDRINYRPVWTLVSGCVLFLLWAWFFLECASLSLNPRFSW